QQMPSLASSVKSTEAEEVNKEIKTERPKPPETSQPKSAPPLKMEEKPPARKMGKIVIDPGHGGEDPGTVGSGGITEKHLALEVAQRENGAASTSADGIDSLLETMLNRVRVHDRVDDSRQFAAEVQSAMYKSAIINTPKLPNRGVKKGPFLVLMKVEMPAILA